MMINRVDGSQLLLGGQQGVSAGQLSLQTMHMCRAATESPAEGSRRTGCTDGG